MRDTQTNETMKTTLRNRIDAITAQRIELSEQIQEARLKGDKETVFALINTIKSCEASLLQVKREYNELA